MNALRVHGVASVGYWLIVVAATLNYAVNTALTPLTNAGAMQSLHLSATASGAIIASAVVTSVLCMVLAGRLCDDRGQWLVCLVSNICSICGLLILMPSFSVQTLVVSRLLCGAGNAGLTVATTSWSTCGTTYRDRGRALGFYGVSVWIGLALGPTVCEYATRIGGLRAAWLTLCIIQFMAMLVLLIVQGGPVSARADANKGEHAGSRELRQPNSPDARGSWVILLVACAIPSTAAIVGWGAEGVLVTYLTQHLEARDMPAIGVFSASSLFTVLAISVIAARIVFNDLTDRLGARQTAMGSMVMLGIGMLLVAWAMTLPVATLAVIIIGVGYSPLFPALTVLTMDRLPNRLCSQGIGVFSASTSMGFYCGSLIGGAAVDVAGTAGAFLMSGLLAFCVIPSLIMRRTKRSHARMTNR